MKKTAPEFGTFALPPKREALRVRADKYGGSRFGRWMISWLRKRAFKGLPDPFDIEINHGLRLRVWPRTNRCEKRVFAGYQIWDTQEHKALADALSQSDTRGTFVFLDVGANVGLYSLFLEHEARKMSRDVRILAIEPDFTNRQRLEFNATANDSEIEIINTAISDRIGEAFLQGGTTNRGEVRMEADGETGQAVPLTTLNALCAAQNVKRIDAMKLDIEGQDLRALTVFFATAEPKLWPNLLILETGREATTPLLELCTTHGYDITARSGINSILKRK